MKNNRTFLEKLLDGAEVEWKPLKDILIRTKGTKITAAEMKVLHKDNAPLKIFAGGKTFALVNFEDIPEKDINKNPSIIVKSRGIIEFEYYDKPFSHKNEMWSYYSNDKNINIKYIYYVLKNQEPYFQNLGSKMQMPQIATPDTDKYLVPIPPLSVQTEIVKILDVLTALTSELTSELILRQKQYEYYREKLLSEEELGKVGFEWKCLKNIFNIFAGGDVPKESYSENKTEEFNIPILSNGIGDKSLYGWTNKAKINKPSLTISARGTIGWTSYREKPFYPIVRLLVLTPKIELNLKYTYYFMKMIEKNYKVPESGIPQLTKPMIEDLRIPVPSFSEQQHIVSILDKFETLTNSITEGLPLAIEQSQKQYEYYRELLLNFS